MSDEKTEVVAVEETASDAPAPAEAEPTPETPDSATEAVAEAPVAAAKDPETEAEEPPAPEAAAETPKQPRPEIQVVKMNLNLEDLPDDLSADDFESALDRTVMEFREGSLVEGTVVRVDPDEVLVDIGFKSEGVIPAKELSIRNTVNPAEIVTVGESIEAMVLEMEDSERERVATDLQSS